MSDATEAQSQPPIDPVVVADAMEDDRFKQFLDHIPVAVAVSELHPSETVTYANLEFQRLTGCDTAAIVGRSWRSLPGIASAVGDNRLLRDAVLDDAEYIGVFHIERGSDTIDVDVWSNTIENDAGDPIYRLVAMASVANDPDDRVQALRNKDVQLNELQHRVKNNLQMITALIRMEARHAANGDGNADDDQRLSRLAGRINALAVLYEALSHNATDDALDLGAYLGQIAAAIMQAHATAGVRLDMKIDSWPVSVNVAMPAGLVVNEVLTNALKHAFVGRDTGTIKLHSLIDDNGCYITIADDGIGFPQGVTWPERGRLSAMIVHSLKQNAGASVTVTSTPGQGVSVTIFFAKPA